MTRKGNLRTYLNSTLGLWHSDNQDLDQGEEQVASEPLGISDCVLRP